jgi:hypothetical protein
MATLRRDLIAKEVEIIRRLKADVWGVRSTPELVRVLITQEVKRLDGSPVPNGKKK